MKKRLSVLILALMLVAVPGWAGEKVNLETKGWMTGLVEVISRWLGLKTEDQPIPPPPAKPNGSAQTKCHTSIDPNGLCRP